MLIDWLPYAKLCYPIAILCMKNAVNTALDAAAALLCSTPHGRSGLTSSWAKPMEVHLSQFAYADVVALKRTRVVFN